MAQVSVTPAIAGGECTGEKHLAFEVISIRRHTAASGPVERGTKTADGFRSMGLPMFAIFQMAYAPPNQSGVLRGDLITGAPGWLSDEPYDIVAKVEEADLADWRKPAMTHTMLPAMLQAMLAERCKAVVHHGSKELPVYDLVVAKGGPKFKLAETTDAAELRRKHPAGGIMSGTGAMVVEGPGGIQLFYAMPMTILAKTILPSVVDRPVADETRLAGYYDLALPSSALRRPPPPAPFGASHPLDAPSIPLQDESTFAALEALGLRLEPAKRQVETLVIDHVERPSSN
jgi:uncharacterized protein (TIGR03435 family)